MCRWLAYSGSPILIEELLYTPTHSLIAQSLKSTLGAEATNGDGFGLGWYSDQETPGVFRSTEPAWNDRNLRAIAGQITSPLVFSHIRASTGSPVQQTNCHPFQYRNWLFMHNGVIYDFPKVKRDLVLRIDPELYPMIEGSTDSEVLFYLALTFGLEDDPPSAISKAVGLVESVGRRHGVEYPIQMTLGITDGTNIWGFRYSSEGKSRTLFFSSEITALRELYPDNPLFQRLDDETRLIVSEPIAELAGAWNEVPESSWGVVKPGDDLIDHFTPSADVE